MVRYSRRRDGRRRRKLGSSTKDAISLTLPLAALIFIALDARCHAVSRPFSRYDHRGKIQVGFTFRSSSSLPTLTTSRTSFKHPYAATHLPYQRTTSLKQSISRSLFQGGRITSLYSADGDSSMDQDISASTASAVTIESTSTTEEVLSEGSNGEGEKNSTIAIASVATDEELDHDDTYFEQMFDNLTQHPETETDEDTSDGEDTVKLVDFIEQTVGIQVKKKRGRSKVKEKDIVTSAFSVEGKEKVVKVKGELTEDAEEKRETDEGGKDSRKSDEVSSSNSEAVASKMDYTASNEFTMASEIAHPPVVQPKSSSATSTNQVTPKPVSSMSLIMEEQPPPSVNEKKEAPYNVVCTHITADFDTLASAIGLAKLWSLGIYDDHINKDDKDCVVNGPLPTYVVLPRGAHPDVQRFLSLHKHLFPIRSLKSLPGFTDSDLKKGKAKNNDDNPMEGLQRVGLVDAQRRDRLGPADILLTHAKLGVTIVDHHVDAESDIQETVNYIIENVGSVSTMIADQIRIKGVELTEAEATMLALGIHSDTGSLVYDSTTPKDASMLAWAMEMGASQTAIAEHAKPTLSTEQQGVLTQALISINSTAVHGVTISTVLLSADGFIPGLATVTKDALDLSSSDVFLLAVCYEATRGAKGGGGGGKTKKKKDNKSKKAGGTKLSKDADEKLQKAKRKTVKAFSSRDTTLLPADVPQLLPGVGGGLSSGSDMINSESWKGGEVAFQRQRLAATFAFYDMDRSGFLEKHEIFQALTSAGFVVSKENFDSLIGSIDTNGDGKIDFEEFVYFYSDMEEQRKWEALRAEIEGKLPGTPSTMTIIGRVKAGVNVRNVNLNKLFQQFNGGGHPKAASATAKLDDESEAKKVLQGLVDELIEDSLEQQLTVGDFMQSPVLSAKPTMSEKQVEDLFIRYDVRALPVVDDDNQVIGLVSYKEVAAAKMRLINKQDKRMRQIEKAAAQGKPLPEARPLESALKGWMKQHVQTVGASMTMAEVENVLLENDVGCIPVVVDNTKQLIGMVTRTDLLRQHRYYSSLHYHNKGFSDSIAARKPIIELRKKLKKFDVENE